MLLVNLSAALIYGDYLVCVYGFNSVSTIVASHEPSLMTSIPRKPLFFWLIKTVWLQQITESKQTQYL